MNAAEAARDEGFMQLALALADRAASQGEVPVGAILVREGKVVGRGHNLRETDQDPVAHAEILALQEAARTLGTFRLDACTAYVTLEPCPMCAGAFVNARIGRVVYGADDPKAGALFSLYRLAEDKRLNHTFPFTRGVLAEPCGNRLSTFFGQIRARKKLGETQASG